MPGRRFLHDLMGAMIIEGTTLACGLENLSQSAPTLRPVQRIEGSGYTVTTYERRLFSSVGQKTEEAGTLSNMQRGEIELLKVAGFLARILCGH